MEKWIEFYRRFFPSFEGAEEFVQACEAQDPPNNTAKLIMHQGQRLISLAEEIPKLRPARPALQVFFLVVCAEAVAKLEEGAAPEGGSRKAVRRFFKELVPEDEQLALSRGLKRYKSTEGLHPRPDDPKKRAADVKRIREVGSEVLLKERDLERLQEVVDFLYDVRCSVAHEGKYWEVGLGIEGQWVFSLPSFQGKEYVVRAKITADQLCTVVAQGCIQAARRSLQPNDTSAAQ